MAAYAGLASLMNNIDQIMIHPRLSASLHKKRIRSLLNTAASLLHFMESCNYGAGSKEGESLEREIASAAHAAEDVIESHIVGQIQRRSNRTSRRCLHDLQQINRDMNAIMKRANELKKREALRLRDEMQTETHPMPTPPIEARETTMVGFEEELIQIMDELTNQRSSRRTISIVGMGGMGKTTLAHNLFHNLLIKQYFDIRAWATVSQQYDVDEILSQLLSGLGDPSGRAVHELGEQLYKTLSGRRFLIILDDVWSVDAWNELRHFFPDNGNRSRVVLTTRLSNVARDSLSNSCFMMKPLDDQARWKLFWKKAFDQEDCPYPELEEIGKEIAELCRGLPLSTVVIGGLLLKSPKSLKLWKNVAFNLQLVPDSKEKEESLDILSLSYNHLPSHLKPCFLYMGVFNEDSEIRVSRIVNLWIAEGFLRPKDTRVLEVVGEDYLQELIDRNLILVSKRRKNGKIGSCIIHDLVRDLCIKVGAQQEFFHVNLTSMEIRGTERRLISCYSYNIQHIGPSLARSVLGSRGLELANHKLLRVCDDSDPGSPMELSGLVNLRYLDHHQRYYFSPGFKLPNSISLLWNLQTLNFVNSGWGEVIVAPIEIWKMRQLRHVNCFGAIHLPHPPPSDGLSIMNHLLTLRRVKNLRLSATQVCEMIPNITKLDLAYDESNFDHLIECASNLDRLHKLESLILISLGKCVDLNKILSLPISLNKLSLNGCLLQCEAVSLIGSLPQLQVLELINVFGREWSPMDGQFLCLKFLKMEWCDFEYWYADQSHFPVLEKLVLVDMHHLEEVPPGIGEIATLELIRVVSCRNSAVISVVKMKEDQLENQGNDDLRVEVVVEDDSELVLFEKMMETEGLTVDNIQLQRRR